MFPLTYAERAVADVVAGAAARLEGLAAAQDRHLGDVTWQGPRADRLRAEGRAIAATLRREANRLRGVATALRRAA
jgi:hypothetical protein